MTHAPTLRRPRRSFLSLGRAALALLVGLVLSQLVLDCAHADDRYSIALEDEFGNVLPTFQQSATSFVMGRERQRYNVRVYNRTGRRVEAVVSVDGRDVISGREGDYIHERGYIVEPYSSLLIEGFRTSFSGVAAFRFSKPGQSYSARMGTPENVGIVGAAFFAEAQIAPAPLLPIPVPMRRSPAQSSRAHDKSGSGLGTSGPSAAEEAKPAAPSARSYEPYDSLADDEASRLGTEYGEQRDSQAVEVPFRRGSARPSSVLTLRYDDEAGLNRRGIETRPRPVRSYPPAPRAFPLSRFAPPPPPYE